MRAAAGRCLKLIVFLLIVLFLWLTVRDTLVMKRDDGITSVKVYYEQPAGTVDVLFAGSSHASYNIAAEELWTRYGITFYQLWGSSQPMWNTYHFLVEAFKTQTPRVVMMDVYGALNSEEYSDEARQATNTLGLRISPNMMENIMVSAPKERWGELFLGLPIYHDRFSELSAEDFIYYPWSKDSLADKGGLPIYGTHDNAVITTADTEKRLPLSEKQETYLRRIIDLCRDKGVSLVMMVTPTVDRADEQPYYNTIADICSAEGVPFVNMNQEDDILILPSDISLDDSHLNMNGARKTGAYIAEYLHEHYDLPDHRSDPAAKSWETYVQNKNTGYIRLLKTPEEFAEEVLRQGYEVLFVRYGEKTAEDHGFQSLAAGSLPNGEGAWLIRSGSAEPLNLSPAQSTCAVYNTDVTIGLSDRSFSIDLVIDPVWKEEGIIAAVYDPAHECWIDAVYCSESEPDNMEHLEFR